MHILVTGAAGFIGSHLAEKLLARGDTVVGLDNFDEYYPRPRKEANLAALRAYASFRFVEGDIRDRAAVLALCAAEGFDAIAHLAGLAGVRNSVRFPEVYIEVDLNGSQHLMDGARLHGVGNFVLASTSSIYGNTERIPFVESDACDRPLQPYAAAKRAVEILGHAYHHLYHLNFTAVRFFTVYGPRNRPDMMAYLVAESITQGTQVSLYEDGQMWRDWTYVDDITDGLLLALDKPLGYAVLNLGRGEPVLLKEFIAILEELAGGSGNFVRREMPASDVRRTYADISKARHLLGYNPQISVREGVTRFWRWYVDAVI